MKRFLSVFLLISGLLMAGGANATSVTWTIPTTALTGSATYTSVSGTFAWDAVNQVVSNVNVTLVVGGTPTLITSSSVNSAPFIVLNNTPPSTGQPVFVIDYTSLTNTATPTVVSYIDGGPCGVSGGQCVGFSGGSSSANNVTLTVGVHEV